MLIQKILCDRCKAEVNGGGYSLSSLGGVIRLAAAKTQPPVSLPTGQAGHFSKGELKGVVDVHLCGKECLMRILNDMVDTISGPTGASGSEGMDSPIEPGNDGSREEEFYETHIAS